MNETRQKILDTMYDLIAEKGYDKTSIGQICEAIGIKKPSVYYYFKSKEEILVCMYEELFMDEFELFSANVNPKISKENYKEFLIEDYTKDISRYKEDKKYNRVMMEYFIQSNRIEAIKTLDDEFSKRMKEYVYRLLEIGVELDMFRDSFDIEFNVEILQNTINGIEMSIVFDMPVKEVEIWEETISRMFLAEGK